MVDWILTEAKINAEGAVIKCIVPLLETMTKLIQEAVRSTRPANADALAILGYEIAIYAVGCLIEVDDSTAIRSLLTYPFLKWKVYHKNSYEVGLRSYYHYSEMAEQWNSGLDKKWISPVAQKLSDRATHKRINFYKLMEADALIFVFNTVNDSNWYPSTAAYAERGPEFKWFQKARVLQNPDRLALIMERETWLEVRNDFIARFGKKLRDSHWAVFRWGSEEYIESMGFNGD